MSTEPVSIDYDGPGSRRIAAVLDDDRRKAALAVLVGAPRPVPEDALALAVAVRIADDEPAEVDEGARRAIRLALHHGDLPRLDDVGLVDRDVGERVVDVTDGGRELARQVLDLDGGTRPTRTTPSTGGGRERLPILVALSGLDAPVGLRSLVDALIDEHETWTDPETAATRLHHVDLPRLADAGLLSYDAADKRVELR